ncbi:MAG: biotin--[acetyl-CoA-carboxylase] ligase [Methanobrevibacter thaueri]|uniref:Biotin--[acetyl-CoA-carboxylase] ligase n=1 Tax=Methanobrevibacter thaueri TaxID=190975 RepID=A0A8T3VA85_9EURY|nr:biotin--[acetyl-CoA-carboxylase] ligase [Methanobrevibacter thaueri]MBE6501750.1 biotin--[acetyl-CoA-carboxylase] ligase [Methanobrevibacter thaueri]
MNNEIQSLLKKEGITSDEINDANINDFADLIEAIGKKKTEHIKSSEISKDLDTKFVGQNLYIYREVNSTNTIAKFLSQNGIGNGSVVIAEKQTAGRGRSGKTWESPLGGIWLSIILTPNVDYSNIPLITLATGVAVAKTLERIEVESCEIKWPNDIMINGKKVCGILTEATTSFNSIENVVVGVGIDANLNIEDFPEELKDKTTSLEIELGRKVDENLLIKLFLEEIEEIFELFNHGRHEEILKEWRKRSYTIGKIVEVKKPFNQPYDAYALGISKEGSLVVEKTDGTLEKVISGECIIKN